MRYRDQETSERPPRPRQIEAHQAAAGPQHAKQFYKGGTQVRHIAQHEAVDDTVEGGVGNGSAIASPAANKTGLPGWVPAFFLAATCTISRQKSTPNTARDPARSISNANSPVPVAISSAIVPPAQPSPPSRAPAPVEPERHKGIDQVVARDDGREHLTDSRGLAFVETKVHSGQPIKLQSETSLPVFSGDHRIIDAHAADLKSKLGSCA